MVEWTRQKSTVSSKTCSIRFSVPCSRWAPAHLLLIVSSFKFQVSNAQPTASPMRVHVFTVTDRKREKGFVMSRGKKKTAFSSENAKKKRLIELIENEKIAKGIILHYNPEKINREVLAIDRKLEELLASKQSILDTRLAVSEKKTAEAIRKLEKIETERSQLKDHFGLIQKIKNLRKVIMDTRSDLRREEIINGVIR